MKIIAYTVEINKKPNPIISAISFNGLDYEGVEINEFPTTKDGIVSFMTFIDGCDSIIEPGSLSKYLYKIIESHGIASRKKYPKIRYSTDELDKTIGLHVLYRMAITYISSQKEVLSTKNV